MSAEGADSPFIVYGALVLVQVLFGLNYVISKLVVDSFPPLVWASLRITVASVAMLAVCLIFRRQSFPRGGRRFFVPMIGFALLGSVINQGSFRVGLRHTTATNSAVLGTMIPVFTLLVVTIRGQERLTVWRSLGFLSALAGVLTLRGIHEFTLGSSTLVGDLLILLNCLSYALFLSFSKKFVENQDRVWVTTWLFIYGSVGLTALAWPDWMSFRWPAMSPLLIGCMAFAIVGGTLLTYFLNVWTLARVRSSSVAIFIYLQPVVAAALAWAWFGQDPTPRTMGAMALICMGMLLGLYSRPPDGSRKVYGPAGLEIIPKPRRV